MTDQYELHDLSEKVNDHLADGDLYRASVLLLRQLPPAEAEDALTEAIGA